MNYLVGWKKLKISIGRYYLTIYPKIKINKKWLLLITLSSPMVSSTNCEKWIDHLLKKYHSSRVGKMTVCNIWLTDESKTIVVLPLPRGSEDSILYDLDVLLVDTQSNKLIAHHWEPDTFGSIVICINKYC